MSLNYDWRIVAKPVSQSDAKKLDKELEYWSEYSDLEGDVYSTEFSTESMYDEEEIESAMRGFSKRYPNIEITVYQKLDTEECPDKNVYKDGDVRYFTGITKYYEFDPKTGQTSQIADDE